MAYILHPDVWRKKALSQAINIVIAAEKTVTDDATWQKLFRTFAYLDSQLLALDGRKYGQGDAR